MANYSATVNVVCLYVSVLCVVVRVTCPLCLCESVNNTSPVHRSYLLLVPSKYTFILHVYKLKMNHNYFLYPSPYLQQL